MSKREFVVYNDEQKCSVLRKGQIYEVSEKSFLTKEADIFHTEYTLKGIEGAFNASWFSPADEVTKSYIVLSYKIPEEGKPMENFFCLNDHDWRPKKRSTTVQAIEKIGTHNIYKVYTMNSIYIVYFPN